MPKFGRIVAALILVLLSACAPKMRIAPGQIPTATLPDTQLKTEAEYYVEQHLQQQSYKEIQVGPQKQRVTNMIERLGRSAGYPPRTFPVHLVDAGEDVNAAAFNGASIVVYKELLARVQSDDELATVLGHEMGHILARHYTEQKEEEQRAQAVNVGSSILGTIASVATSVAGYGGAADLAGDVTSKSAGLIGYGAFVGSFNRRQEYEADHLGLLIMAKAGYDPRIAVKFWQRAKEVFGSSSSQLGAFFNTHPAEKDRQQKLDEALPLALQLYQPPTPIAEEPKSPSKTRKKN